MSQQELCATGAAKGIDTRFLLHPLAANQMELLGISSAQLIGFSSEILDYDPLDRRISGKIAGSQSYDEVQVTMYIRPRSKDQEDLRMLATDQIEFNDLFIYYQRVGTDFTHFQALDLAQDRCGVFTISGWSQQSFGRSDLKTVQFTLSTNGTVAEYDRHTDTLIWTMEDGILTATDAFFEDMDFRVGMSVIYETGDAAKPYGYGLISGLTQTTMTLINTTLNTTGGTGKIHGARIHYKDEVVL